METTEFSSSDKKIKWINLTPHNIKIYRGNRVLRNFPTSGEVARIRTQINLMEIIDGIPIYQRRKLITVGLPKPKKDTIYIVSYLVLAANPKRTDLVSPEAGFLKIKNKLGLITGVTGFQRIDTHE